MKRRIQVLSDFCYEIDKENPLNFPKDFEGKRTITDANFCPICIHFKEEKTNHCDTCNICVP